MTFFQRDDCAGARMIRFYAIGSCWQKPFARPPGGARPAVRGGRKTWNAAPNRVPLRKPNAFLHAKGDIPCQE